MDTVSTTAITLKPRTFAKICQLVLERWGISLNSGKETLVRSRIAKRMRMLELRDVEDYLVYVLEDRTGVELQRLVDAISTNTTSFYREPDHFNFIRGVVDQWARDGARLLRIWSTAASTGEEPYTLAIELSETLESRPVEVRILATDINTEVLKTARRGVYPGQTVQPVPKELRTRYFTRQGPEDDCVYTVNERLKKMILYRQFNLSRSPYPIKPNVDLIMCRNVMIYFGPEMRSKLVSEFERLLRPGGYLIVGHAESVSSFAKHLKCIKPSIYVRV
ncbi:MAG: protein-glutamate O-methyltransferase CheR [Candidatus Zixiibacteriota bacterium]